MQMNEHGRVASIYVPNVFLPPCLPPAAIFYVLELEEVLGKA